ncbi:integrase arm-type DNA-binding domain-containing protein [Bradyrhizobium sp. SSUT77]|uniref:tyrosine-type recombinase/integrase n=1 Tax=Bradyrhizobium sp. SSUT77 TaxID=3040603 RepID=UPI00244899BA|nr:integrase arm-type DNA-binding domain-containing protein [Bradyrhizobium sp. SSUT77]MDH2341496.1 tyrosine-type recombinase/integrase [Bradyrhizobium sp. SSUT77]
MPLTDAACRAAKKAEKPYKLSDGGGLYILVETSGSRLWRQAYRFGGKQKLIALGAYPSITLADARIARDANKALLAKGVDPSDKRRADKIAASAAHLTTFDAVADAWIAKQRETSKSATTLDKLTWIIDLVRPQIGQLQIGAITSSDVLAALRKVEAAGRHGKNRYETTKRCRATLSRVFSYAVAEGLREFDPAAAFAKSGHLTPPPTRSYAAIVDPKAFGALLRAIDGYDGTKETRLALQLLALTALRPGELRQLRWDWVAEDIKQPAITLPPEVMKMRREHKVPLSRQAIAILAELREITGWSSIHAAAGADYVFPNAQPRRLIGKDGMPSKRPALRPMSEGALGSALRRLGYSSDTHVPHGFRSSFSTLANTSRLFDADIIEAALAHSDGNQIRSIYNRATYDADRTRLAQWWSDYLDDLRRAGAVVSIAKARSGAGSRSVA